MVGRKRLRKLARAHHDEERAHRGEEPEYRAPAERCEEPAADHRRDRRRQPEEKRHQRHEPLRVLGTEEVADHRAAHHHPRAHRKPLHDTPHDQRLHAARERGARGGDGVDHECHEDHGPAAEAVGKRAVEKEHQPEREEVRRERLLQLERRGVERLLDSRERGKVRVDREGTEGGERREHRGESPAEPSRVVMRIGHRRHSNDLRRDRTLPRVRSRAALRRLSPLWRCGGRGRETAIAECLRDMRLAGLGRIREVGDGARDAHHALMRTRR